MTTDPIAPVPRRRQPRLNLSGPEWKLYLAAGLALTYSGTLLGITHQVATAEAVAAADTVAQTITPAASASPAPVWIDELPPANRPTPALPEGWVLASPGSSAAPSQPGQPTAPRGPEPAAPPLVAAAPSETGSSRPQPPSVAAAAPPPPPVARPAAPPPAPRAAVPRIRTRSS